MGKTLLRNVVFLIRNYDMLPLPGRYAKTSLEDLEAATLTKLKQPLGTPVCHDLQLASCRCGYVLGGIRVGLQRSVPFHPASVGQALRPQRLGSIS